MHGEDRGRYRCFGGKWSRTSSRVVESTTSTCAGPSDRPEAQGTLLPSPCNRLQRLHVPSSQRLRCGASQSRCAALPLPLAPLPLALPAVRSKVDGRQRDLKVVLLNAPAPNTSFHPSLAGNIRVQTLWSLRRGIGVAEVVQRACGASIFRPAASRAGAPSLALQGQRFDDGALSFLPNGSFSPTKPTCPDLGRARSRLEPVQPHRKHTTQHSSVSAAGCDHRTFTKTLLLLLLLMIRTPKRGRWVLQRSL